MRISTKGLKALSLSLLHAEGTLNAVGQQHWEQVKSKVVQVTNFGVTVGMPDRLPPPPAPPDHRLKSWPVRVRSQNFGNGTTAPKHYGAQVQLPLAMAQKSAYFCAPEL